MPYQSTDPDTAPAKPKVKGDVVEFRPPSEFHAPDPAEPGEPFQLVCEFAVRPDGRLCLVMLGDTPMPQPKDKGKPEKAPDYRDMSKSIIGGMGIGSDMSA